MKTYSAKPNEVRQNWYWIDAKGQTLGRLAAKIAYILRGKHKPEFTPHVDTGDYIVVTNAHKIEVTGRKETRKMYYHHSGYIGGLKAMSFDKVRAEKPERILQEAVKGMLPKGPLGRQMYKKLKVYAQTDHPHHAQQPQKLELNNSEGEV